MSTHAWTASEVAALVQAHGRENWSTIRAYLPSRTLKAIRMKAFKLGVYIPSDLNPQPRWSHRELSMLRRVWKRDTLVGVENHFPGRARAAIFQKANKLGLKKSPYYGTNRLHPVKWKFWKKWSPNLAYMLGFLAADGHITRTSLRVQLAIKDRCLLEKFVELGGGSIYEMKSSQGHDTAIWIVNSPALVVRLKQLGMCTRKSESTIVQNIPQSFWRHFVRGNLDGDGSVGIYRKQLRYTYCVSLFLGNKRFLAELESLIRRSIRTLPKEPYHLGNRLYRLQYSAIKEVVSLAKWIYSGSRLYLSRKKSIFLSILRRASRRGMRASVLPLPEEAP